jgi:ketosteroid isomerase-like protein
VSEENVELVRDAVEAWNRADRSWLDYLAPDVELLPAGPAAVEQEVYRGHDEVAGWYAEVFGRWDVFECTEGGVRDLGDSVLWLGHVKVRGHVSEVELDQPWAIQCTFVAGKVVRCQTFLSWDEALKSVGLEE